MQFGSCLKGVVDRDEEGSVPDVLQNLAFRFGVL